MKNSRALKLASQRDFADFRTKNASASLTRLSFRGLAPKANTISLSRARQHVFMAHWSRTQGTSRSLNRLG
jgi:hypothetical protein